VTHLHEAAAYGEQRGIVVALQNHNHNGVAAYGKDILGLLAGVNHPNLAHVMDTGQYLDLYDSMSMTVHKAVHVRCKIYEIESGEERRLDYTRIFPILQQANYNGFLSIVYEGKEDEQAAVAKAVPYLRRFMR
jgi:sugar phosphate isomerase/epimerase